MSDKEFENTLNEFTSGSDSAAEDTEPKDAEGEAAEIKSAADTIVENAANNTEAVQEAEEAITDDTVVIDAEIVSEESADTAKPDFDSTQSLDAEGFDAGNPQYEEHSQSRCDSEPTYAGAAGSYGGGSYGQSSGQAYYQAVDAKAHRGFVKKSTFIVVLIIAMLLTMLASVGITTAYTSYLNQQILSKVNTTTDNHATKYELTTSEETLSYKSIIDKADDSVVSITTESVTNDMWMQNYVTQGAGSGVIIQSDGYIITCEHVVEGARKITVTTKDGKEYNATLIGSDADQDIAVIKIDATGLTAATYGDSSKLEVGDTAVVIGNPLGRLSGTVTTGIISALDRKINIEGREMTLLQTDASINPGNSGGGMFDKSGNLIGIVEAKSTGSDIDGLGFATPINTAAKIAKELIENEGKGGSNNGSSSSKSGTPMIGIMVAEIDEALSSQYGYAHGGLLVRSVTSPQAQMSGLNEGDIIYEAAGKTVTTQDDLTKVLKGKKAGDKLKLSVAREDGSTAEVETILVSKNDAQ